MSAALRLLVGSSLLVAASALAEVRGGSTVLIGPGEVVEGDLYAAASTVRVEGVVTGDLVTTAGQVEIPGEVRGDVLAAAGTAMVSGQVRGSLRALAGQLDLSGEVGEDVLAGVGSFSSVATSAIGRDFIASAGEVRLRGPVGGGLRIAAGNVVLGGPVAGPAKLTVQSLTLEDGARLANALDYQSAQAATIAPGARVGLVSRSAPEQASAAEVAAGFLIAWARGLFAFTLLGVLLAVISPRFARAVPEVLRKAPWHSLGWGALVVLAAPFVVLALFIGGVLLGGWWLGLIAAGLALSAMALSFPVVGYRLGQWALRSPGATRGRRFGALLLGVAGVTLILRVPLLGGLLALGVVLFGLGAMVLAGLQLRRSNGSAMSF